jgi:hypothetical protein
MDLRKIYGKFFLPLISDRSFGFLGKNEDLSAIERLLIASIVYGCAFPRLEVKRMAEGEPWDSRRVLAENL